MVPPVGRSGRGLNSQFSLVPDLLSSVHVLTTRATQPPPSSSSAPSTVLSGRDAQRSPARGVHVPGVFLPPDRRVCHARIFCRFWLWPRLSGGCPLLRLFLCLTRRRRWRRVGSTSRRRRFFLRRLPLFWVLYGILSIIWRFCSVFQA